jgi:hypothetical protein
MNPFSEGLFDWITACYSLTWRSICCCLNGPNADRPRAILLESHGRHRHPGRLPDREGPSNPREHPSRLRARGPTLPPSGLELVLHYEFQI